MDLDEYEQAKSRLHIRVDADTYLRLRLTRIQVKHMLALRRKQMERAWMSMLLWQYQYDTRPL